MAAILCDSVGKLCSLPCQLCGSCVKGCTGLCGDCCQGCSSCCGSCCTSFGECCRSISKAICSAFFPYLFLTMILNLPPAIWGVQTRAGCGQSVWLWVNTAVCFLHVAISIYVVTRIVNAKSGSNNGTSHDDTNTAPPPPQEVKDEERGFGARMTQAFTHERSSSSEGGGGREEMKQILCYDPIVALYLLSFMGWLAWLCFGIVYLAEDEDEQCQNNRNAVFLSLGTGFTYALLVCCTIPCAYACLR